MAQARRVPTDDMAPSILIRDLIWVKSTQPKRGDIVLLQDPHDKKRVYLRRVMAIAGEQVHPLPNGALRHNGRTLRQRDMGQMDPYRVFQESTWSDEQEAIQYLVQRLLDAPQSAQQNEQTVPENHLYVMADSRDKSIDSRWWGPIPNTLVEGVVYLQVGPSHKWRNWIIWHN